jgi:hypothetical protein
MSNSLLARAPGLVHRSRPADLCRPCIARNRRFPLRRHLSSSRLRLQHGHYHDQDPLFPYRRIESVTSFSSLKTALVSPKDTVDKPRRKKGETKDGEKSIDKASQAKKPSKPKKARATEKLVGSGTIAPAEIESRCKFRIASPSFVSCNV